MSLFELVYLRCFTSSVPKRVPASLHACISASLHLCAPACLHACPPARLPACPPVCLRASVCMYVCMSSRHKGSNLGPSCLGPKLDPL